MLFVGVRFRVMIKGGAQRIRVTVTVTMTSENDFFSAYDFYSFFPSFSRKPLIDQFATVMNGLDTPVWDSVSDDAKEVVLIATHER